MKYWSVSVAVLAAMILAGCGIQPGTTIVKFKEGSPLLMAQALENGTYALYASTDATPMARYALRQGEKVGFRQQGDQVIAVAGNNEVPLDPNRLAKTYYWKMQD